MIFDDDSYNVLEPAKFDESTESVKHVVFHPSLGSDLNRFSDTRIHCLGKDYYYLPSESYLTIKGQVKDKTTDAAFADTAEIAFTNLGPLFLVKSYWKLMEERWSQLTTLELLPR